jgi:hypothetical protein
MLHTHNSADDLDDTKADRGRSSGSGFASGSDGEGEGLGVYALSLSYLILHCCLGNFSVTAAAC